MDMKTLLKSVMLVTAAVTAFACTKDRGVATPEADRLILHAEKPDLMTDGTRTEMIGGDPHWSVGDRIGVHVFDNADSNHEFVGTHSEACPSTDFQGDQLTPGAQIVAYYPYSPTAVADGAAVALCPRGAMVDLPSVQRPEATSFCGTADLLVSDPILLDADGEPSGDLTFNRLGAVLRVNLIDKDGSFAGKKITSLTIDTGDPDYHLAGSVVIDLEEQTLLAPCADESTSVTALYDDPATAPAFGTGTYEKGSDAPAIYLGVYPGTIPSGMSLIVKATTDDGMQIERAIAFTSDFNVAAAKISTFNIKVGAEHVMTSGLALPFSDDFTNLTGTAAISATKFRTRTGPSNRLLWSDANQLHAYNKPYGLRVSANTSNLENLGYIVTNDLDLTGDFHVLITAKAYPKDATAIKVTVGDTQVQTTAGLSETFETYALNFNAEDTKTKIRFEPSVERKRIIIGKIEIKPGHVALPPELTITTPSPVEVLSAGGTVTIDYDLAHPADGQSIAASVGADIDWIGGFDYTVPGKISFVVQDNPSQSVGRKADVTITYGDLAPRTIRINQLSIDGHTPAGDAYTHQPSSTLKWTAWGEALESDIMSWTPVLVTGNASAIPDDYLGNRGQRFGTADHAITEMTLTGEGFTDGIDRITLRSHAASGHTMTIGVTVGGVAMTPVTNGTYHASGTAAVESEFTSTGSLTGDVVITYHSQAAGAIYVDRIVINP